LPRWGIAAFLLGPLPALVPAWALLAPLAGTQTMSQETGRKGYFA
jgi:hypothetical protein